jgi:polyisoprenoid-binding protein YceI
MMQCRAALCSLAALAGAAHAAPEEFTVDPGHTYPSFEVRHLGISTQRGRFEKTAGRIVLDRAAGTGVIEIDIDATTLSTGNRLLDPQLKGDDFFDTDKFPSITFRSTQLEMDKGDLKGARGTLTMLGVAQPVKLVVEHFGCTRLPFFVRLTCGADAVAQVSRSAFGMSRFTTFISDEVRIVIQIEAVKKEPAQEPAPAGG